jgi:class 3 adenylate cyclase
VVEESDGDLMGDGVNIAARLEASRNQVESVSVSHDLVFCKWDRDATLFRRRVLRQFVNVDLPT